MKALEPGFYDRSEIDYELIDAVNQSTLKLIGKSPLHYLHTLENGTKATAPMRLGSVAHCLLLEPETFDSRFAIWNPPGKKDDFRGKDFEAFEQLAQARGVTIIKQRERDAADRMREAVQCSQPARRYLQRGKAEVAMVWRDEKTGLPCKALVDWLSQSVPDVMCEFKTARDVSPWAFEPAFARAGYDVQAAFYVDGYRAITGRELYAKCIAIENAEPHDVIVYDLSEVVDVGRDLYREMLERLAECRASNRWPGQSPLNERTLRLPKWRDPEEPNDLADLGLEMESM